MRKFVPVALLISALIASLSPLPYLRSQEKKQQAKTVTRLFFQDFETQSIKWADVKLVGKKRFQLSPIQSVKGLKSFDADKQRLVQMNAAKSMVMCGVRDQEDGQFESGWFMVHSGAMQEEHGDHEHWRYQKEPEVWASQLDAKQGNPAHLYTYQGVFYLANDRNNGYTRINPAEYGIDKSGQRRLATPHWIPGGGGHITLAVADGKVGYSCWIDGGGPNKGKVDVTSLSQLPPKGISYSFTLPTGGIHGATYNSGKVFFAPQDGICWVNADMDLKKSGQDVKVTHISLGKDGEKPRRTGAFTNYRDYVLFTTGRDDNSALVLLNAKDTQPTPQFLPIPVKQGNRITTPTVVRSPWGRAYALIFHDHAGDEKIQDYLTIIDLDPSRDHNCSDARIVDTIPVGPSKVNGHYGHHDVCFDADGRYAFFTNPGNGKISVLSLRDREIVAEFAVGGTPSTIVSVGGMETED